MSIFTTPKSTGAISSFPVNLAHVLYFRRGTRMVEKTVGGKMTKTNYDTIEFVFINNKEIYWYFEKPADLEEEYSRLLVL